MSSWAEKFTIGLTGNIATGKSVVRRMLEHLGAYGIDADSLAHRALAKGAPGYKPVVRAFGSWILSPDGQIDRARLGRIVFTDKEAMRQLEAIVHPLVSQAVDILIRRSKHRIVVIEAIKLLEAGLGSKCDSIWVTYASPEIQVQRLVQRRKMTREEALQRIQSQPPQEQKIKAADVVIKNEGSFEETWVQVNLAWQSLPLTEEARTSTSEPIKLENKLHVIRARPQHAEVIAELINRLDARGVQLTRDDVMEAFGDKAFLLLRQGERAVGVIGWKVENLVARSESIYLQSGIPVPEALKAMLEEVEKASKELQSEISLLFIPGSLQAYQDVFRSLGYQTGEAGKLGVRAWDEAALESQPPGTSLLYKKLRSDRVLRPI